MLCTAADIKPGDRVMVILPTIPEYWVIQAACLRTGIVKLLSRKTAVRYGRRRLSIRLY